MRVGSRLISAVAAPSRDAAHAASAPAWPPPITMMSGTMPFENTGHTESKAGQCTAPKKDNSTARDMAHFPLQCLEALPHEQTRKDQK